MQIFLRFPIFLIFLALVTVFLTLPGLGKLPCWFSLAMADVVLRRSLAHLTLHRWIFSSPGPYVNQNPPTGCSPLSPGEVHPIRCPS